MLLLSALTQANAQFTIKNTDEVATIKSGITYVVMDDTGSAMAQKYKALYQKYWTLSEVKFITYADIDRNMKPGASFISVDVEAAMTQSGNDMAANQGNLGGQLGGNNLRYTGAYTYVYLSLWIPEEKFFKKNKKRFKDSYKTEVAKIALFPDNYMSAKDIYEYNSNNYDHYKTEYSIDIYSDTGAQYIYNWGLGFAKNYIQLLVSYLDKDMEKSLYKGIERNGLRALAKSNLCIPDYVLINFSPSKKEGKMFNEKDMMQDYRYKYTMIKRGELNAKIIDGNIEFYYLILFKSSTDKWVTVIDSKTGEMLYSSYTPMSKYMKPKDMKTLYKEIGG